MARSSGIPRSVGVHGITRIIGARTSATTINRPTESLNDLGETETTTSDHTEDLWLFEPQEAATEIPAGEHVTGQLAALGLDGIDVQREDRITHGGAEYEVDTVIGQPEDNDADGTTHTDTAYFVVNLVRRTT